MEKNNRSNLTIIEILLVIVFMIAVNRFFDWYVTHRYFDLINKSGFIEVFQSGKPENLKEVLSKYNVQYLTLSRGKIIEKTSPSLPTIHPIMAEIKYSDDTIPYEYKQALKKMRPYILLHRWELLIVFLLSFNNQDSKYIVFHKLLP